MQPAGRIEEQVPRSGAGRQADDRFAGDQLAGGFVDRVPVDGVGAEVHGEHPARGTGTTMWACGLAWRSGCGPRPLWLTIRWPTGTPASSSRMAVTLPLT